MGYLNASDGPTLTGPQLRIPHRKLATTALA